MAVFFSLCFWRLFSPPPLHGFDGAEKEELRRASGAWRKGKKLCQNFTQAFHNLFLEIVTPSVEWFPHDCLPPCHCKPRNESSTTSQHLHVLHYAKKETRWFVGTLAKCEALDGGVFLLCYRACKLLDFFLAYKHMNSVRSRLRVFECVWSPHAGGGGGEPAARQETLLPTSLSSSSQIVWMQWRRRICCFVAAAVVTNEFPPSLPQPPAPPPSIPGPSGGARRPASKSCRGRHYQVEKQVFQLFEAACVCVGGGGGSLAPGSNDVRT